MPVPSALILLAGGSGSGKSTLARLLSVRFPEWTIVHLDDYQKSKESVPRLGSHRNWDHPDAVDFAALVRDLRALRRGESVTIMCRSQTEQALTGVPTKVSPGPVLLLEGYLALWHPDVRALADYGIFLDMPRGLRHARRRWNMDEDYVRNILDPMHDEHLQPTMAYANLVIHAGSSPPESALETIVRCLTPYL